MQFLAIEKSSTRSYPIWVLVHLCAFSTRPKWKRHCRDTGCSKWCI